MKGRVAALSLIAMLSVPAHADSVLVIDSPYLGMRSKVIDGLDQMTQDEVSREAALFALAPEGWDLASRGGELRSFGPPDAPAWGGGVAWSIRGIPGDASGDFGYPLNQQAIDLGGRRHLVFHTDDWLSKSWHNICELRPFGAISGLLDGQYFQCAVGDWGTYWVIACIGDLDDSGDVGVGDVLLVLAQWGPCPPDCFADIDRNGVVDVQDLLAVLAAWGQCD